LDRPNATDPIKVSYIMFAGTKLGG
jgi:hypothetical protein